MNLKRIAQEAYKITEGLGSDSSNHAMLLSIEGDLLQAKDLVSFAKSHPEDIPKALQLIDSAMKKIRKL